VFAADLAEELPARRPHALHARPVDDVVRPEVLEQPARCRRLADARRTEFPAGLRGLAAGDRHKQALQRLEFALAAREIAWKVGLSEDVPLREHNRSVTRDGYIKGGRGWLRENENCR